jgi:hypothetical protein
VKVVSQGFIQRRAEIVGVYGKVTEHQVVVAALAHKVVGHHFINRVQILEATQPVPFHTSMFVTRDPTGWLGLMVYLNPDNLGKTAIGGGDTALRRFQEPLSHRFPAVSKVAMALPKGSVSSTSPMVTRASQDWRPQTAAVLESDLVIGAGLRNGLPSTAWHPPPGCPSGTRPSGRSADHPH